MSSAHEAGFGYRIHAADGGWRWATFDSAGRPVEQGWAPEKALAAACIVRALTCEVPPASVLAAA
jgi:hypothetical protein